MTRILVLYYSSYGHVRALAEAEAEGALSVAGTTVDIRRIPETVPEPVRRAAGYVDDDTPVATPADLAAYDGIIFGTPTRFGNMSGQMRIFLDQTGGLWQKGALAGKVGSVFTSTGTGGGNETTITSFHSTLLHHGMVIVGLPYAVGTELFDISEVRGGSPYGASTLAGGDGSRQPSDKELSLARKQGAHVASIAAKLSV